MLKLKQTRPKRDVIRGIVNAILSVTHKWITTTGELYTDLVCPSGDELYPHLTELIAATLCLVVEDRFLGAVGVLGCDKGHFPFLVTEKVILQ